MTSNVSRALLAAGLLVSSSMVACRDWSFTTPPGTPTPTPTVTPTPTPSGTPTLSMTCDDEALKNWFEPNNSCAAGTTIVPSVISQSFIAGICPATEYDFYSFQG